MNQEQLLKDLGARIKSIRESKEVSQMELAARINSEKSNISRLEAGRTNPTYTHLYKISQALNVSITELVDV